MLLGVSRKPELGIYLHYLIGGSARLVIIAAS
jgi:hypothetical protein